MGQGAESPATGRDLGLDVVRSKDDLAQSLRALRRRHARDHADTELTYRELSSKSGYSLGAISDYFTGNVLPSTDRLEVLATLLGATGAERGRFATARDRVEEAGRDTPAVVGRVSTVSVPRQLPASTRHFTGRVPEVDALTALAADGHRTVVVTAIEGTAGIGKTCLAVHWAHQIMSHFPDGQLYINLHGFDPAMQPTEPAEAVRILLDAFAIPAEQIPLSFEAQIGLYRSILANRRVLIVLDNARDAAQVEPLLPGSATCMVVITSRSRLTPLVAQGAYSLVLDVLTVEEAHQMLESYVGSRRIVDEIAASEALIQLCARLPLALSIVAARAAVSTRVSLSDLAAELSDSHSRLDAMANSQASGGVRAAFSWSYGGLSSSAARLFRLLDVHPGPEISLAAAQSIVQLSAAETQSLLTELTESHLLDERRPNRYTLHDLLRTYAHECARNEEGVNGVRTAISRLLSFYHSAAHTAAMLLNPTRDPLPNMLDMNATTELPLIANYDSAMSWFETEHLVLMAVIAQASAEGFGTYAWRLAWTLVNYLDWRGHWRDYNLTQQQALEAAKRLGDAAGQAWAHRYLGSAFARLGASNEALDHLTNALTLFEEIGDRASQARTHLALAHPLHQLGRHTDVLEHDYRAIALYEDLNHRVGLADAHNSTGWALALAGEYRQALEHCEKAIALHQEIQYEHGQAETWDSLGHIHHNLENFTLSIDCYNNALVLYRDLGDTYYEADTLTHLGDVLSAQGDEAAARSAWQRALDIFEVLGHSDSERIRAKIDDYST